MHELALARSLIEMIDAYALEHQSTSVTRINVKLGTLSAITRALYVSFRAASRGTSCENAALEIEEIPLTVRCRFCDDVKTPSGRYNFRCPDCGHSTPEIVTGREMQLVSITLAETTPTPPPSHVETSQPSLKLG